MGDTKRLRVVVADDHPMVLERLQGILECEYAVVAAVSDGAAALSETRRLSPDVVVCDVGMPGRNGFDVARELLCAAAATRLVFVTTIADPAYVTEAFRIGVSGYVLKSAAGSELCAAVRSAAAGGRYLSSGLRGSIS